MEKSNYEIIKKANDFYEKSDYVSALKTIDEIKNPDEQILKFKFSMLLSISDVCEKQKDYISYIYCLQEMEKIKPDEENILLSIALSFEKIKDSPNALVYYMKILNINKQNYEALIHIATLFAKVGKFDDALSYIEKAKVIKPNQYETAFAYYKVYEGTYNYKEAIKYAKEMVELNPKLELGIYSCARTYFYLFDYKNALEYCDKFLELKPDDVDTLCLRIECMQNMGVFDSLELLYKEYKDLILKYPLSYTAKRMYTFNLLRNKVYDKAMEYYQYVVSPQGREDDGKKVSEKSVKYKQKAWDREDITGKNLLIHQGTFGAGDYIMFTRYITQLEKTAKKVIIEADKNFYELFKYNFKNSNVILETKELIPENDYDYSVSCMELFYCMNLGFDKCLNSKGWLNIPEEKIQEKKDLGIFNTNKKKIGIFWHGSGGPMRYRDMKLENFIPILELENCKFYSLDIVKKEKNTLELMEKYNITDCSQYIKDVMDTGSILKNLDLLITIDSFPVHLSGALGVKTWLILPVIGEWRWFDDDKTTIWYDSVEIFKQSQTKNIETIVELFKKNLHN